MYAEGERGIGFGAVRELKSGRWQARYRGPDGLMRPAGQTSATKTDADVGLTRKEAEILGGECIDPEAGKVKLAGCGATWIEERPNLRPKTIGLYRYLLRTHIAPHFAGVSVSEIKEPQVRRWRKKLLDSGVSEVTTAKAYRPLKAILNTAADDGHPPQPKVLNVSGQISRGCTPDVPPMCPGWLWSSCRILDRPSEIVKIFGDEREPGAAMR